jgi:hypothetical protein
MRALAVDAEGRRILVGLTFEETEEVVRFLSDRMDPRLCRADYVISADRYLELHEKHEAQRLAILMAESELRQSRPVRH